MVRLQLQKLPVNIKFKCTVDRENDRKHNADVVIFATGSTPKKLDFSGKTTFTRLLNFSITKKKPGRTLLLWVAA